MTRWSRLGLLAIVGLALALRLVAIDRVPPDPFYDAAVRAMSGSGHAFFVGALEPGARVAIDKPPFALWLQVASTKLLGFDRVSLQLPIVLAGVGAVVLLYDLVRRLAGPACGLAAALVLATAPIAVLTDRSDTMDSIMSALLVLSAWLIVRAAETERTWLLWAAGVTAGLAFEVKLGEALIAVPALAVLAVLAWPGPRRQLLVTGAAFVLTALAWLVAMSLLPAAGRPYALGSTNGSEWNIVVGYNGVGRLSGVKSAVAPHVGATLSRPGAVRLLDAKNQLGARLGVTVLTALAFGLLALASAEWRALRHNRTAVAAVAALAVWLFCGLVVFSAMQHLHTRYLVQLAPPAAAAVGVGVVALARAGTRRRWPPVACAVGAAAVAAFAATLVHDPAALRAVVALAFAALALGLALGGALRRVAWPPLLAGAALAAVITIPVALSVDIVRTAQNDAGQAGQMAPAIQRRLSAYLIAHQGGARDEAAVENPFTAAGIIVHDNRPILVLDNTSDRPLVPVAALRAAVRKGQVRYALLGPGCRQPTRRRLPGCADSRWVLAHGVDVTAAAGLWAGTHHTAVYRLSRSDERRSPGTDGRLRGRPSVPPGSATAGRTGRLTVK